MSLYLGTTPVANSGTSVSDIFPVGSCYVTIGNTNPNTILGIGTWTLVTSSVITSVDTNVPIKGTGLRMGLTDGINDDMGFCHLPSNQFRVGTVYGNAGANMSNTYNTQDYAAYGLTTNSNQSGIVGTVTRTSTTIYIWQRTE